MKVGVLIILLVVALDVSSKLLEREIEHEIWFTESAISEKRLAVPDYQEITKNPPKVLTVSDDNDDRKDSNGEYTSASVKRPKLPDSFTVCLAFKFDAWTVNTPDNRILTMLKDRNDSPMIQWGYITLDALSNYTKFDAKLGPVMLTEVSAVVFPQQWTRFCLFLDLSAKMAHFVVDGWILREQPYIKEDDLERPSRLDLVLGFVPDSQNEHQGEVTNFNFYSNALSIDVMMDITRSGSTECDSSSGDLLSWEDTEWTLHSKAR